MNRQQVYIVFIILILSLLFFLKKDTKRNELPDSIGDPLELIIIRDSNEFSQSFHKKLREHLILDIGPAPQQEHLLSITELESKKFTGIFKRHQNLLFINKSEQFNISIKKNLFAKSECPFWNS